MKLNRKRKGKWITVTVATAAMIGMQSIGVSAESEGVSVETSATSETVVAYSEDESVAAEPAVNIEPAEVEQPEVTSVETINAEVTEASTEVVAESDEQLETEPQTIETTQEQEKEQSVVLEENAVEPINDDANKAEVVQSEATSTNESQIKPLTIDTNHLINANKIWETGHKGEGQVVAIIDSGLFVDHDAFHGITDITKAYYVNQEAMEKAKAAAGITYGKWYNSKIVFGYNYTDVNEKLVESSHDSHGTHVAGIAVGNPSKEFAAPTPTDPNHAEKIYGVAPEAQLMFMRVFSDTVDGGTTSEFLYIRAIEDAVKLGATSINLSLGGANGSLFDTSEPLRLAIQRATQAGVVVVMAAGNDNSFGSGHNNPLATNPDYGVVGSPSTAPGTISVASFDAGVNFNKVLSGSYTDANGNIQKLMIQSSFGPNGTAEALENGNFSQHQLVFAELGKETDFTNLDLTGKVALIQRGEITFVDKVRHAKNAGAIAAIIFNAPGDDSLISMAIDEDDLKGFPALFIGNTDGVALKNHISTASIDLRAKIVKILNDKEFKPSSFSSWGLSADGELRPDLAAPGGGIFAAVNNNEYASLNGTSMASPHVAGAVALLQEALQKKYPNLAPEERAVLIKQLLMSTAVPHFNTESSAYTSPRKQGAGIIDVAQAIASQVYLTSSKGASSINLGNVQDKVDLAVNVHNISNKAITLIPTAYLITDKVEQGAFGNQFALVQETLAQIVGEKLTVEAGTIGRTNLTFDTSAFTERLSQLMPNGYYLEGYIRFANEEGAVVASIPFTSFRGEFQNLPVIEKPYYDHSFTQGDYPFYYFDLSTGQVAKGSNTTSLITKVSELNRVIGIRGNNQIILGTYGTTQKPNDLEVDNDPIFAISPNNDGHKDDVTFKGVFLRNFEEASVSVYAVDDINREKPLWMSEVVEGYKNFYSGNVDRPKSTILDGTTWDGTDFNGQALPDGTYQYVLTYRSIVPGADNQELAFNVILDRTAPVVTSATFDENTRLLTLTNVYETVSGIYEARTRLSVLSTDANGKEVETFIYRNDKGEFVIPADVDIYDAKVLLHVEDRAGNVLLTPVNRLFTEDNGFVSLRLEAANHPSRLDVTRYGARFEVRDSTGKVVELIHADPANPSTNWRLPYGEYIVTLVNYNQSALALIGEATQALTLTADAPKADLVFDVNILSQKTLRVAFNRVLPENAQVIAISKTGQQFVVQASRYVPNVHEINLPTGEYVLQVSLPENLGVSENNVPINLTENNDFKYLTIFDVANKTELKYFVDLATVVDLTVIDQDVASALTSALEEAEKLLSTADATQADVDKAAATLRDVLEHLKGRGDGTDYDLPKFPEFKIPLMIANATAQALNLDGYTAESVAQFKEALAVAKEVLEDANATEEAVQKALDGLNTATQSLVKVEEPASDDSGNQEPTPAPDDKDNQEPAPVPVDNDHQDPQEEKPSESELIKLPLLEALQRAKVAASTSNWTEESLSALQSAVQNAEQLLAGPVTSVSAILDAIIDLTKATENLVLASENNATDESTVDHTSTKQSVVVNKAEQASATKQSALPHTGEANALVQVTTLVGITGILGASLLATKRKENE